MKVLIKAMRPHRQKVLTEDGEEMRLQQWANKAASSALRGAGGDASGERFTQARDALMREAVANPDEHGLKFMGERMPFDGQELEESLSEPDVAGEQAAFDSEFAPAHEEHEELHAAQEEATEGLDESEIDRSKPGAGLFNEQGKLRQTLPQDPMDDPDFKEDMDEDESFELAEKLDQNKFDPDAEAEHLRRIMTSRQVPMRDAWSVLKNDFFNPPKVPCAKCGRPTEPMMYYGSNEMGPQHNTLCENCEDNTMMEDQ